MNKSLFFRKAVSSGRSTMNYYDSFYLNNEYDSAIMGFDYETGSVIYSHKKLVCICLENLDNEGRLDQIPVMHELFLSIVVSIMAGFSDIHERIDGIPPILLLDIDDEFKLIA